MNHDVNIVLVVFFSTVLACIMAWPLVKRWYYSRLKTPFQITLKGRTYSIDPKLDECVVEQMERQDKVFDALEAAKSNPK